jgi:hypothetical protein
VNGIFVTAGANVNVYYNTIYLNSSSTGAIFGSSAVYAGTASTKLDLRNNILVNKSNHNGNTGFTVALRRNGAFDAVNYAETSNTNDMLVSSASPILNYIYYDGTSGLPGKDSTIEAFKARVYPRDAGSFTENPPFIDVAATPYNLHMQETQTKCESGGSQISAPFAILTDVDNQLRFPDPSCPNNPGFPASAPDVGADEFAGTPVFTCALPDPGNTLSSVDAMCSGQTTTLSIQNLPTGTGNSFQWQISPDNVNYSDMPNAITASYTFAPSATAYYKCKVTCQQVPALVSYSNPLLVSMKYNITSATGSERCGTGTVKLLAEGTGPQLNWYAVPVGGSPVGSGSPFFSPVISSTTTYYVGSESPIPGSVTIGAGATTSATYSNPFYSAWSNTHNQHMIRASELNAAGLIAGDITSLAINITLLDFIR